jgi:hypothetical protein
MKIAATCSHLNGLEFLLVHKPKLWEEIRDVISEVNAAQCRTKVSKEKTKHGKLLFSLVGLNAAFREQLRAKSWNESRVSYWVTRSERLIRQTLPLCAEEQKRQIEAAGETPIFS